MCRGCMDQITKKITQRPKGIQVALLEAISLSVKRGKDSHTLQHGWSRVVVEGDIFDGVFVRVQRTEFVSHQNGLSSASVAYQHDWSPPLQQTVHEIAHTDGLRSVDETGLEETHAGSVPIDFMFQLKLYLSFPACKDARMPAVMTTDVWAKAYLRYCFWSNFNTALHMQSHNTLQPALKDCRRCKRNASKYKEKNTDIQKYKPGEVCLDPSQISGSFLSTARIFSSLDRCSNQIQCLEPGTLWFWTPSPTTYWIPPCNPRAVAKAYRNYRL